MHSSAKTGFLKKTEDDRNLMKEKLEDFKLVVPCCPSVIFKWLILTHPSAGVFCVSSCLACLRVWLVCVLRLSACFGCLCVWVVCLFCSLRAQLLNLLFFHDSTSRCKFSTSCSFAFAKHLIYFHADEDKMIPKEKKLSGELQRIRPR